MADAYPSSASGVAVESLHVTLRSFPIACFSLALLTDIAYWQTSNLLWLHFSEWLLLAGIALGVIAVLAGGLDYLVRGRRPASLAVIASVAVLALGAINNFVHTADGWTAVVPYGLTLSAATVLAMIIAGWLGRQGMHHV